MEENLALARIAERVTRLKPVKFDDARWMATAAGVSATIPQGLIPSLERFMGTSTTKSSLSKADLLTFLLSSYGGPPERFPRLLELLLKHALSRFVAVDGPGYIRRSPEAMGMRNNELESHRRYFAACASVLGLGLDLERGTDALDSLQVRFFKEELGETPRAERDRLHHILEASYPEELKKLEGAYERYTSGGPDAYREAVESCRSAYEFFFRKLTGALTDSKWSARLEGTFPQQSFCTFVRDAYTYLSGVGTHSPHERELAEALLAIRSTEGIMVAALMTCGKW